MSYSRDTGLYGKTLFDGLSNSGSQQFWTIDPAADPSFAKFSQASGDLSNDVWLVIGGGKSAGVIAGTNNIFTTMVNTVADGELNPQWEFLTGVNNSSLRNKTTDFSGTLYSPLSAGNGTAFNNYATVSAGNYASSFDDASSGSYLGSMTRLLGNADGGLSAGDALFGGNSPQGFNTGNTLKTEGTSSWFYY